MIAQRTLDDVRAEIVEISDRLAGHEELHRRRRALYLEAKEWPDGGMLTKDIAADAKCTKEAVTLQLRRARSEAGRE